MDRYCSGRLATYSDFLLQSLLQKRNFTKLFYSTPRSEDKLRDIATALVSFFRPVCQDATGFTTELFMDAANRYSDQDRLEEQWSRTGSDVLTPNDANRWYVTDVLGYCKGRSKLKLGMMEDKKRDFNYMDVIQTVVDLFVDYYNVIVPILPYLYYNLIANHTEKQGHKGKDKRRNEEYSSSLNSCND